MTNEQTNQTAIDGESARLQSIVNRLRELASGPASQNPEHWDDVNLMAEAANVIERFADPRLVLMPRELTAENGAKGALSGEFAVCCTMPNPDYDPEFDDDPEEDEPETLEQVVPVSWTTIKSIYRRAVATVAVCGD